MSEVIYDPKSPSGLSRRGRRAGYLHGSGYWVARWREGDKSREKHFSCKKYGDKEARSLAVEYRNVKLKEDGAEYTERHGREA